ncbi:MAG: hypothetical protein M3083_22805 [Actinomycetota bacterium]|nr:hypothetical protein [Actinomycetota bacterium]
MRLPAIVVTSAMVMTALVVTLMVNGSLRGPRCGGAGPSDSDGDGESNPDGETGLGGTVHQGSFDGG